VQPIRAFGMVAETGWKFGQKCYQISDISELASLQTIDILSKENFWHNFCE